MVRVYHPTSYTWEAHAIINSVIHEYENPDEQDVNYNPFEWHDPWNLRIIYTPPEITSDSDTTQELSEEQYFTSESESISPEPWEWWSEQLFC